MHRVIISVAALFLLMGSVPQQALCEQQGVKILSMVVEQRVKQRPFAWWVEDKDLSVLERALARGLSTYGIVVVEPAELKPLMKASNFKPALSARDCSVKNLAAEAGARYIINGTVQVSPGLKLKKPSQKKQNDQFASVQVVMTDVTTGKIVARFLVWGRAPTRDAAGIDQALRDAGEKLAARVIRSFQGKGE